MKSIKHTIWVATLAIIFSLLLRFNASAAGDAWVSEASTVGYADKTIFIYADKDMSSEVIGEYESNTSVYIVSPGIPWSKVFVDGNPGYVLTADLRFQDIDDLKRDPAFDEAAMLEEAKSDLVWAYMQDNRIESVKMYIPITVSLIALAVLIILRQLLRHKREKRE